MKNVRRVAWWPAGLALILGLALLVRDSVGRQEQDVDLRRAEILAIAESYANLRWRGEENNVLHGVDSMGVRVDTPDTSFDEEGWKPGRDDNVGMPYSWGGFSSIEDFKAGLRRGLHAGNIPTSERAGASRSALGVDCSGFVSRCWELPVKHSTRSLGSVCYELEDYSELQPGDALNKFDGHVVLFKSFVDEKRTKLRVIEAARLRVKENVYTARTMRRRGFLPMRYRPLDPRWESMSLSEPDLHVGPGKFRAQGEPRTLLDGLIDPLADGARGEWARYEWRSTDAEDEAQQMTRLLVSRTTDQTTVQQVRTVHGKDLPTGSVQLPGREPAQRLVDFLGLNDPVDRVELEACTLEDGRFTVGGREFAAQRVTAKVKASLTMRHARFPMTLEFDVVLSNEVPLRGVLRAEVTIEVTWSAGPEGKRVSSSERRELELIEFGNRSPK